MRPHKQTAWRKSRKFGDVFGGRTRPKRTDGLFRRLHSFSAPTAGTPTPILIEDNPSRDFFFPLDGQTVVDALRQLPHEDVAGITHVWLRRVKTSEFRSGERPLAEFVCGSGVRLIILYPWPRDMLLPLGSRRPPAGLLRRYSRWTTDLVQANGEWCLRWTLPALQSFMIEGLLFHEVGHHVDWYTRRWTTANRRRAEGFADQYAAQWTARTRRPRPEGTAALE